MGDSLKLANLGRTKHKPRLQCINIALNWTVILPSPSSGWPWKTVMNGNPPNEQSYKHYSPLFPFYDSQSGFKCIDIPKIAAVTNHLANL